MLGLSKNMENTEPKFVDVIDIIQMANYIGSLSKGFNDLQLIQMSIKSHEEMNLFPRRKDLEDYLSDYQNLYNSANQTDKVVNYLLGNIC